MSSVPVFFFRQGDSNDTGSVDLESDGAPFNIPVGSTLTFQAVESASAARARHAPAAEFTAASAEIDGLVPNRVNFTLDQANLASPATRYEAVVEVLFPDGVTRITWPMQGIISLIIVPPPGS